MSFWISLHSLRFEDRSWREDSPWISQQQYVLQYTNVTDKWLTLSLCCYNHIDYATDVAHARKKQVILNSWDQRPLVRNIRTTEIAANGN